MRTRILFYSLIGLSVVVILFLWRGLSSDDQGPVQIFPATVKRDCAPWDGAAFTLSIHYDQDSVIDISIWRSPDIHGPIKFSFPDSTHSIGAAMLLQQAGAPEELTGSVHFQGVDEGIPVDGEFSLTMESGRQIEGKFIAIWANEIVACG